MKPFIDEGHKKTRSNMRIVGPLILVIGIIFAVVGAASLFLNGGRYFWCGFIGLPLIFVGSVLSQFAFMGSFLKYVSREAAPVGKDTFNYMADGTKDSVRDLASAVSEGFVSGMRQVGEGGADVRCSGCGEENDYDAKFCKQCGGEMNAVKACPACHEQNDPDARFCDNCGGQL